LYVCGFCGIDTLLLVALSVTPGGYRERNGLGELLVPDTSCSMMRNCVCPFSRLPFLHGVVQEEVDQDRIYSRLGLLAQDLLPDQLNRPDTAATKF